jgi:hypothetical protein
MSGTLAAFQAGIGRALLGEASCPIDPASPGFRFTLSVRRSWCKGRSIMAARAVLEALPDEESQRLVSEYLEQGGGSEVSLAIENERFLQFLLPRLPDPSMALSICRMNQALNLARRGAMNFSPPELRNPDAPVVRGQYASLVWYRTGPHEAPMPPAGEKSLSAESPESAVLFAPGLPNLFRLASQAEAGFWRALPAIDAPRGLIASLLRDGVIEYPD